MFKVGDRVRVITADFSMHTPVGTTGRITMENTALYADSKESAFNVLMDSGLWAGNDVMFYASELEYEDNRQAALTNEKIAYDHDYVWLKDAEPCDPPNINHKQPFEFFCNYRKGDTAIIIRCPGCGNVMGSSALPITVDRISSIGYMNTEPRLFNDQGRRLE